MDPYIEELKSVWGLDDDFLHQLARSGDVTPLVDLLLQEGDAAAAEEMRLLPERLRLAGYGRWG